MDVERSGLPPRSLIGRRSRRCVLKALAAGIALAPVVSPRAVAGQGGEWFTDLDDRGDLWQVYIDPPGRTVGREIGHVPSPDRAGVALRIAIESGEPYTGVQGYALLGPTPEAQALELQLDWRFSETTFNNEGAPSVIQAIELTINKWAGDGRFEWAMQWENVSDGTDQAGFPPTWRLWTGTRWQDTGVTQRLAGNQWHSFRLQGDISNGQVRYLGFASDEIAQPLGHVFPPTTLQGDEQLTVAFQLDGNYRQDPYDCLFDNVSLGWWASNPW